jgi:ribosome biogenesis ATPase
VFFDELDALVPTRDNGTNSESSARVVNTLLSELDGIGNSRDGIYFMGATNRPDVIDPAMLRPGRVDNMLYVGLPNEEGRVDILRTLSKKVNGLVFDEKIAGVARQAEGFSGADLASLTRRAGMEAVRRAMGRGDGEIQVTPEDFTVARSATRQSVGRDDRRRYEALERHWNARG